MYVTGKAIDRRTFLKGAGATVALPFLGAMVPAMKASAASRPTPRMGFFYVPNGIHPPSFHPAGEGGSGYKFTPVLEPLAPIREHVTVVTGLSNIATARGGGGHSSAHSGWLNGAPSKQTEGSDIRAGKTLDQYAADHLGRDTILRSLELTTEDSIVAGLCELGYSCVYRNSTSWLTPTTPLPHENNPRAVFERLFGTEATPEARARELANDRSILDSVAEEMKRLERRLGIGDQRTVSDYMGAIRDVEARIEKIEKSQKDAVGAGYERPTGIPADFRDHIRILFDLLVLAYRGDITRVSCTQIGRENGNRSYPWVGVNSGHHGITHHGNDPAKIQQQVTIDTYHMTLFRDFVETLRDIPDGDGSLLDQSLLMYGCGLGDGNTHSFSNLPVVIAGGANGNHKGGRHLVYPMDTPLMNAGVTLLDKVGVHVDKIGDSTGRLALL
ncbi:MAG: DUF1552 domain-containing protein [Gammaproteobacteria bacterium]|nr:DUF1552 domain-containing protein [Gammaproteobacteria bacterium]MDE0441585.1 DUF1552 domain-containing protein [Gammaproteobacteria bacterium]